MGSNDKLTITNSDENYHLSEKLSTSKYKTVLSTDEELVRQIEADKEYICEKCASYGAKYGECS